MKTSKTLDSFEQYKLNIQESSFEERTEAVNRHVRMLTASDQSVETDFTHRMRGSKKQWGQNSQSYDQILVTLQILDDFMDEMLTDEIAAGGIEKFVRDGLLETYALLIRQCDVYIASHGGKRWTTAGRERVEMIKELSSKAKDEAQLMTERLSSVEKLGKGITLRQLLAGMRPLETVAAKVSDFSLPASQLKSQNLSINQLSVLRSSLKMSKTIDDDGRALLNILLEQITRLCFQGGRNQSGNTLCADLLDRVITLCDSYNKGKEDPILSALSDTCMNLKETENLQSSTRNDTYTYNKPFNLQQGAGNGGASYNVFPEYHYMNAGDFRNLARGNRFNEGEAMVQLYGSYNRKEENDEGKSYNKKHGYILTNTAFKINAYLREISQKNAKDRLENNPDAKNVSKNFSSLRTIGMLDDATQSGELTQKTRLHRMLTSYYLAYNFDIKGVDDRGINIPNGTVRAINEQAGKVITDSNFMCTGFAVDKLFMRYPIMLTLLCDEGTPVFFTRNFAEGEITLGRGTQYMILGAVSHGTRNGISSSDGVQVPVTHGNTGNQENEEEFFTDFSGIEIFAKVLKKG